ncbi:hypothetical protein V9T40_013236 [Parthenolecanium corni]|uniref:Glucose-methanol-choline oxidoreductase N-terminal domain-containing protein n=1 Tax=Parthenolecanium corni TaxID=536013 RepID=A0AAN9Y5I7_9HEMI
MRPIIVLAPVLVVFLICEGAEAAGAESEDTFYSAFRYATRYVLKQLQSRLGNADNERNVRSAIQEEGYTADVAHVRKQYDFVVVGAGSGGSVVANRLTEVSNWTVLLLEAGDEENFMTDVPLLVSYVTGSDDFNWGYRTERQPEACLGMRAQRCNWPRGKVMGGTSVINYMVYTRGFASDYDAWRSLGNEGWGYEQVLPYFLKSEDARFEAAAGAERHGRGGYLAVEKGNWRSPLAPHFMDACRELGYAVEDDDDNFNSVRRRSDRQAAGGDALSTSGCSYVLANTKRGARCSASKAFLRPVRRRRNLHVSKRSRALTVIVEAKGGREPRAVGVEYLKQGRRRRVFAAKEVILSAGALNTPQLLMLSGIGPADHLEALGIPVVHDLRGVGQNLQDHVSMAGLAFLVNDSVTIVESRYRRLEYALQYLFEGRGPYTVPGGAEVVAFSRTKYADPRYASPDLELVFGPGALTGDTGGSLRRMLNIDEQIFARVYEPFLGRDAWALVPVLLKPRSRGHVKLRSANPLHAPLFYPNYFQDKRDLLTLVEGIKQVSSAKVQNINFEFLLSFHTRAETC